jgi:PhoPQ-activated pathogenicity-related protein
MHICKKIVLLLTIILIYIVNISYATALDDYVAEIDANYSFTHEYSFFYLSTFTTGHILKLTSQQWRDSTEVNHPIWTHWVTVIVPVFTSTDTALLLINGGDTNDPMPEIEKDFRLLAAGTESVVVVISAVPNQPLIFTDETIPRSEDEIIAYSWDKFLNGGDDYWPAQLPMVKSVVRCMDAVQTFASTSTGGSKTINNFVLTGGSKRGWTAWLTAAVDSRVVAIAPIVSDLLNMKRSFAHHWAAYGFWADALSPYEDLGIFEWFDAPEITALLQIVDPFEYLDRLDIPKFIINSAGDDFFVSDSIQFYINDLPGETYLRHVPNTDHYLTDAFEDVFKSMLPYYDAFLYSDPRPEFSWSIENDGAILVQTIDAPKAVNLWQAHNPATRDFRLTTIGPAWTSSALTDPGDGSYIASVPTPETGWTAFFVELIYQSPFQGTDEYDYRFTSEMVVLPEILPFEADFSRDRSTDMLDLAIFTEAWLTDNAYRDIAPRRGGDGIVNLPDLAILASHWFE